MSFAEKVKKYYALGLWNEKRVHDAVKKGALTAQEFKAITGKDFSD